MSEDFFHTRTLESWENHDLKLSYTLRGLFTKGACINPLPHGKFNVPVLESEWEFDLHIPAMSRVH